MKKIMSEKQARVPYFEKLIEYSQKDVASFDVPGHKRGRLKNELVDFLGKNVFSFDSNAPRGLDNLNFPKGVIKEAQELAAEAFGADETYFLTGGTTIGILAMILSVIRAKEKIILPRNVHKSVINALILSGGIPIFIKPNIDNDLGIANGISFMDVKEAIDNNLDAKAILIINPTYFGVVSDLKSITDYAHSKDMLVLTDEAHGGNFYFCDSLPKSAMSLNVDMSALSSHKTLGSFTQSSILLIKGDRVDKKRLRGTLNILQSTSPNQLFIASLDVSRKQMYFEGEEKLNKIIKIIKNTIKEINQIRGFSSCGKEYFLQKGAFDYDETKLVIKVSDLGLTGFDLYKILASEYDIQMELAESKIALAVASIGNLKKDFDRLIKALKEISEKYDNSDIKMDNKSIYAYPITYIRPREAYQAPKKTVLIANALDEIAAESIMVYPPGIPLVIPGEVISEEIIAAIEAYLASDSTVLSDSDEGYVRVIDKDNWIKWEESEEDV